MLKRREEMERVERPNFKGGAGVVLSGSWPVELPAHVKLVNVNTLNPGDEIGYHVHQNETEIYYVLEGELEFNDNGQEKTAKKGDILFTGHNTGHSAVNKSDKPATIFAIIIME